MENNAARIENISVIITTRGRVRLVDELLDSVRQAGIKFEGKYETIILDDSELQDAETLKAICKKTPCQLCARSCQSHSKT